MRAASFLETLVTYPRQRTSSFNIDEVMRELMPTR